MEQVTTNHFENRVRIFNGSTLKIIAVISMVIDHFAAGILLFCLQSNASFIGENWVWWNNIYTICRNIGRTAFPLYCFFIVEGFLHTKSRSKYAINLFVFALLSELPFDYMVYHGFTMVKQNVFFTLLLGLLVIWAMEWCESHFWDPGKELCMKVVFVMLGCIVATLVHSDYSHRGVLLIAIFYFLREYRILAGIMGYVCMFYEPWSLPAFLLIQFYNGKRGIRMKYPFYLVYPVHMLLFYFIWLYISKG